MPAATPVKPKRKFRRVATVLAIVLLTPPAIVGGAAWYYSRPERLARILEEALGENIHGTVHIEKAHLSWSGTLKVENLRIGLANQTGPYAQVLAAPLATIRLSRRQLLKLNPVVLAVDLESPVVHLVEDPATNRVNWLDLGVKDTGQTHKTPPLPLFTLHHGTISFETLAADGRLDSRAEKNAVWQLDGTLTPVAGALQAATVALTAKRPDGKTASLAGSFDLDARTAAVDLKGGCLRPEFALLLPRESRAWLRMLSAEGEIPLLAGEVDWSDGLKIHSAKAKVKDLSIHPDIRPLLGDQQKTPSGKLMAAAADQLWFDHINGEAVVTDNLLRLPDLRATAHGENLGLGTVEAKLSGQLNLTGQNQWGLAFTTERFVLADKIPILELFPDVRTIYQRFSPAGTLRVSGRAEAKGLSATPVVEARVELIDAKANYAQRPYPVEHLTGTLIATLDSIELENLRGKGVLGGSVTVAGKVAPLTEAAGADITVTLADVPYGEPILGAMGKNTAKAVRGMLSAPATEALRARKLPAPEPGGMINATLKITRKEGLDGHWGILADVDAAGLQVILPQWPYPMRILEGRVAASETQVHVTGVKAAGPSGGTVEMEASAGESGAGGHWGWSVAIKDASLPVDEWFYASLPKNAERSARLVGVEGRVRVDGSLAQDPGNDKDPELHINLHGAVKDGSANPFGAGYVLEKLAMDMTLHAGDFLINEAQGTHGTSVFTAQEKVSWSPAFGNLLTVSAKDLAFEADLARLAPPDSEAQKRMQALFAKWAFEGNGNAAFRWDTDAKDAQTIGVEVWPKAFSMRSPIGARERVDLYDMGGKAVIGEGGVRLHGISGRFEDGSAAADGLITQTQAGDADIDVQVSGKTDLYDGMLPDTLLALLPPTLVESIENSNATGRIAASGGRVRMKGANTDFAVRLETAGLDFDLGLPVRKAAGSLQLAYAGKSGKTATTGGISLTSCELFGRRLSSGKTRMEVAADGAWRLDAFSARLAGGFLNGSAAGTADAWALDADLADASFDGIKSPESWDGSPEKGGILSGRARLRNTAGGFKNLAGDGDFDLKSADFGGKNSKLDLIEILNGVRPGQPISAAAGHFTANGPTLVLDRIVLSSAGGLRIENDGDGTVTLPGAAIDLRLKTRNSAAVSWLARVERVTRPFIREILGLKVTGTLGNPEVTADSFASLKSMWRELLPGTDDAVDRVKDKLKRQRR